jgi:riboflavin kinase / FMN adenylyltransferase
LPKIQYLKTYTHSSQFIPTPSVVTIGTFDGVHVGHRKILEKLITRAKEMKCESVVLSFFPHPRQHDTSIKLLNTLDEKIKLMDELGIDHLIIHPFDQEFSNLSAEQFVKELLVDQLHTQKIIIGYDHRFGKNRSADISDLIEFGATYNFEVEQISAEEINEIAVSSTKIRTSLLNADLETATHFLGYPYEFSGIVVQGKQLGRTIGFPTANIAIDQEYKLLPKNGVYVVKVTFENESLYGMMNIGVRPTVDGLTQTVEVFLFNFEREIYNTHLTVTVLKFIRDEEKFESLDALKSQIQNDKTVALDFLSH